MQQSKFDKFITEMDSTMWPIPGQDMNNRNAAYKQVPSVQAILQQPPDTDNAGIIGAAPTFGTPLEHIMETSTNAFHELQNMKSMFVAAKASPVYQGRKRQQKVLDDMIEKIEKVQNYMYKKIIQEMETLSLASLGDDNTLE